MTRSQYDGVVKFERHVRCDDECRNATINAQCVFRSIYPSSCLPSARIAACIAIILFHLHPHTILPAPITTPYPQPTAPPATVCSPGFHSATGGQGTFIKLSSDSRVRVGSAQPKRPPPPPGQRSAEPELTSGFRTISAGSATQRRAASTMGLGAAGRFFFRRVRVVPHV